MNYDIILNKKIIYETIKHCNFNKNIKFYLRDNKTL